MRGVVSVSYVLRVCVMPVEHFAETLNCEPSVRFEAWSSKFITQTLCLTSLLPWQLRWPPWSPTKVAKVTHVWRTVGRHSPETFNAASYGMSAVCVSWQKSWVASKCNMTPNVPQVACRRSWMGVTSWRNQYADIALYGDRIPLPLKQLLCEFRILTMSSVVWVVALLYTPGKCWNPDRAVLCFRARAKSFPDNSSFPDLMDKFSSAPDLT